jgi:hypothetical protein
MLLLLTLMMMMMMTKNRDRYFIKVTNSKLNDQDPIVGWGSIFSSLPVQMNCGVQVSIYQVGIGSYFIEDTAVKA